MIEITMPNAEVFLFVFVLIALVTAVKSRILYKEDSRPTNIFEAYKVRYARPANWELVKTIHYQAGYINSNGHVICRENGVYILRAFDGTCMGKCDFMGNPIEDNSNGE